MFYFGPDKYTNTCKIVTRCTIVKVLEKLEQTLEDMELEWFTDDQNQLKHLFHMPRERNRKSMGMLMLVLRTAVLEKCKAWWFVVNGVPVRYSLWEHGVISGLDCSVYPPNYLCLGSNDFVMKWFKCIKKISVSDVEKVLESMIACEDRLKMAVLYFLAMIMEAKTKVGGPIDPFLLRIVDDLDVCKTFPWGRYSFNVCSDGLENMIANLNSSVKSSVNYGGFIIPMELLAFEAIPSLRKKYRIDVASMNDCPRMCQRKFKSYGQKGYPLSDINETLGGSKDISSTLEATLREHQYLVSRIGVEEFHRDNGNPIARGMMAHLSDGKKIFWQELYDQDVATRPKNQLVAKVGEEEGHEEEHASETVRAEESLQGGEEEEHASETVRAEESLHGGEEQEHASENVRADFMREFREELLHTQTAVKKSILSVIEMMDALRDLVMVMGGRLTNVEEAVRRLQKDMKGKEKVEEVFDEVDLTRSCGDASGSGGGNIGDEYGEGEEDGGGEEEEPIVPEPVGSWAIILAPTSPPPLSGPYTPEELAAMYADPPSFYEPPMYGEPIFYEPEPVKPILVEPEQVEPERRVSKRKTKASKLVSSPWTQEKKKMKRIEENKRKKMDEKKKNEAEEKEDKKKKKKV